MPGRNITLKAVFIEKGYAIVINGSAAADKQRADAGETVKITSSIAGQNPGNVKVEYGYESLFSEQDDRSLDYSDTYGELSYDVATGTFVLPEGVTLKDGMIILVTVDGTTQKKYEVKVDVTKASSTKAGGTVSVPGRVDFIFMDMMMPVMDGLEAARQIRTLNRKDTKEIPIIAMTANAFQDDIRDCIDAGMNAHIAKPIDSKKIEDTLQLVLKQKMQ